MLFPFFFFLNYIDFVQWRLPVYLDHISPSFWPSDPCHCRHWPCCHLWNECPTRCKLRFLRPIEKCVACVERLLIQNVAPWSTALPVRQHGRSHHLGKTALRNVTLLECNSTTAAAFSSDKFCGMLLASAGLFDGCHSIVDPKPFIPDCVCKMCVSNGNNFLFCIV